MPGRLPCGSSRNQLIPCYPRPVACPRGFDREPKTLRMRAESVFSSINRWLLSSTLVRPSFLTKDLTELVFPNVFEKPSFFPSLNFCLDASCRIVAVSGVCTFRSRSLFTISAACIFIFILFADIFGNNYVAVWRDQCKINNCMM